MYSLVLNDLLLKITSTIASFLRYGHLASSAVTGQSFARELMSAGLIIAGQDYYETVGYPEATTILAAFATVLGVLPFVFSRYGPTIRARSHYSLEVSCFSMITDSLMVFLGRILLLIEKRLVHRSNKLLKPIWNVKKWKKHVKEVKAIIHRYNNNTSKRPVSRK